MLLFKNNALCTHANRIQDDLRKSSMFLFKNKTYVTTRGCAHDHLCLC